MVSGLPCAVRLYELHPQPWLLQHWGYTGVTSWVCYMKSILWLRCGYIMVMLWLFIWLLCQAGERLCYGCHASQERINTSAVPMAPRVFFQSLSAYLTYLSSVNSTNSVNSKTAGITKGPAKTVLLSTGTMFYTRYLEFFHLA